MIPTEFASSVGVTPTDEVGRLTLNPDTKPGDRHSGVSKRLAKRAFHCVRNFADARRCGLVKSGRMLPSTTSLNRVPTAPLIARGRIKGDNFVEIALTV